MAARLHVYSLGTLELEGALLPEPTLTTILVTAWAWMDGTPSSSVTSRLATMDASRFRTRAASKGAYFSRATEQPKKTAA